MPYDAGQSQWMPTTSHANTDTARTRAIRRKLDDRMAREAAPPESGNRVTYDTRLPGFGFRITAAGSRSFVFNYRIKGRERRIRTSEY